MSFGQRNLRESVSRSTWGRGSPCRLPTRRDAFLSTPARRPDERRPVPAGNVSGARNLARAALWGRFVICGRVALGLLRRNSASVYTLPACEVPESAETARSLAETLSPPHSVSQRSGRWRMAPDFHP